MELKFLVDECLSPQLADLAVERGHLQSTCVRNKGWAGKKDHEITDIAVEHDYTLVTHNAKDFRGRGGELPGGHYARLELHAGLVCITAADIDLDIQLEMFGVALDELDQMPDLINKCLEVEFVEDAITVNVYEIGA